MRQIMDTWYRVIADFSFLLMVVIYVYGEKIMYWIVEKIFSTLKLWFWHFILFYFQMADQMFFGYTVETDDMILNKLNFPLIICSIFL